MLGFFLGCCGVVIAVLFWRRNYLPGALVGCAGAVVLWTVASLFENLNVDSVVDLTTAIPWELVVACLLVVVVAGLLFGVGVWAFGGVLDEEEVPPEPVRTPPPPPVVPPDIRPSSSGQTFRGDRLVETDQASPARSVAPADDEDDDDDGGSGGEPSEWVTFPHD